MILDDVSKFFSAGASAVQQTTQSISQEVAEAKKAAIEYGQISLTLQALSTAAAVTMALIAISNHNRGSGGRAKKRKR